MTNAPQPASLDEGLVIFKKIDDETFGIQGVDLTPDQVVTVSTKNGPGKEVIVREIIEDSHGIQTATFDWVQTDIEFTPGVVIFKKIDDKTYGIQGLDLVEGEKVTVTLKNGKTVTVTVGKIIELDENLATATYIPDPVEFDNEKVTFRKLDDGAWGIKGKGLTAGKTVTVTKKDGATKKVKVVKILSDTDGIQTASTQPIPGNEND